MGVSVRETNPDTKIAAPMVTANSCSNRPRIPPINRSGMNTAASERVMDKMVKLISADPLNAACKAPSPISMCRTMFSSITIASSTTNPTHKVRAIMERLSKL